MTFCLAAALNAGVSSVTPSPRPLSRLMLKWGYGVFALLLVLGCSPSSPKSEPSPNATSPKAESPVLRLHWLGKKRLAGEASATNFMAIWSMPESEKLERQTLDKLSTAPWRLLPKATSLSNAPVALLRPLLDDLIQAESYLEVHHATNQPGQLVLAIRLDAARAARWQTNFPVVLDSLKPSLSYDLALTRAGEWTLLSLTHGVGHRATDSGLLAEFKSRIQRAGTPLTQTGSNHWVQVSTDLIRLGQALGFNWKLPPTTPRIELSMFGEGENVRSLGTLMLSQPLAQPLDGWHFPSNAIPKSITSFTAARAVGDGLGLLLPFDRWQVGTPPDQCFVWSLPSLPMQTVLAIPLVRDDQRPTLVRQWLLTAGNAWLATNSVGKWTEMDGSAGVQWEGAPFMTPFVRPFTDPAGQFLGFGIVPTPITNSVPNRDLAGRLHARTNAVYYDWEFTGPRIESWFYLGQLARVIFGRGQLPTEAPVTRWLKALQPKLANAGTVIALVDPTKLTFERTSTLGFTAVELHLFADWIESPRFPLGLHTTQVELKRKLSAFPAGGPAPPK